MRPLPSRLARRGRRLAAVAQHPQGRGRRQRLHPGGRVLLGCLRARGPYPIRRSAASRVREIDPHDRCCAARSIHESRRCAPCRTTSGILSIAARKQHVTGVRQCERHASTGCRTPFAASPPALDSAPAELLYRSGGGAVLGRAADHPQRHRGDRRAAGSRRALDIRRLRADRQQEPTVGGRGLGVFRRAHASVLGALLDAVATGLRRFPRWIRPPDLPRMADFAHWAIACESALWKDGDFPARLQRQHPGRGRERAGGKPGRGRSTQDDGGPGEGGTPRGPEKWEGTATDLLSKLTDLVAERVCQAKTWPSNGRALSGRLRRASSFLRKVEIDVAFAREGHARTRQIVITTTTPPTAGRRG